MALVFLTKDDFEGKTGAATLSQLTEGDDSNLEQHEAMAMAYITDMLGELYDLDTAFATSGANRNNSLLRIMLALAVYYLYDHIPDDEIPERVWKNYDDVRKELEKIAGGKKNIGIIKLQDSEGNTVTTFRAGSNEARGHNPF